jgi:hypothetical protein
MKELPRELAAYIAEEQKNRREANTADYRPTTRAELERLSKAAIANYERGLEVTKKISGRDLVRCRSLYAMRNGGTTGEGQLRYERIDGVWALYPNFICLIEEVRKLKQIFA